MKRKTFCALFLALFFITIAQTGCGSKEPITRTSFYFNTPCSITLYDMQEEEAQSLITELFRQCKEMEALLSKTIPTSDVARINAAGGEPVEVSSITIQVLEKAVDYSVLSEGAFDVTVGKLTDLWDFQAESPVVPSAHQIQEALPTVDYRGIEISGNRVSLSNPDSAIDLGGIAKGFIADRLTESLEAKGIERGIINLGGNIVALGEKEEDTGWEIGIEKPYSDRREIVEVVSLSDQSVVTSGIYERAFQVDGRLFHHVLDVKTGYPVQSDLESVTIIGPKGSSADCDALSTIALILGSQKGMALIESLEGFEASFVCKNGEILHTSAMNAWPVDSDAAVVDRQRAQSD